TARGRPREREADSGPLVDADVQVLDLLERREDPFPEGGVDARPAVDDPDLDAAVGPADPHLHRVLRPGEPAGVVDELMQDAPGDGGIQVGDRCRVALERYPDVRVTAGDLAGDRGDVHP